jgi:hypothetical protein
MRHSLDNAAMTDRDFNGLRQLLLTQRVAALGTLHRGEPAVSMVPYALLPGTGQFIIHISRLATHTADVLDHPRVSLMVMAEPSPADGVLALPRATVSGDAELLADGPERDAARAAYLARLPDSAPLFDFGDFGLFAIRPRAVRHVGGFGRAYSLTAERFAQVMAGTEATERAAGDSEGDVMDPLQRERGPEPDGPTR